ncbi:MAG: phosphoribosyl-AMP cyclohydrolase [Caulobacter sp.]|nr:phosphoribosyl-AMP cyclohydrolase [Caulobacter sp.]
MTTFPAAPTTEALERGADIAPRFDANGLIAAIAQHVDSGEVLMLAWMNDQALRLTLDTGLAHYFSRSRDELWKKGETSGQLQDVVEIRLDCDQDAVLLKVRPRGDGGACHVGFRSCFYRLVENGELVERE